MSQTVEWTRQRIVRQMIALKQYISQLPDNQGMLARMSGKDGDRFLQRTTDFIMAELGHETVPQATARSRRVVTGS